MRAAHAKGAEVKIMLAERLIASQFKGFLNFSFISTESPMEGTEEVTQRRDTTTDVPTALKKPSRRWAL